MFKTLIFTCILCTHFLLVNIPLFSQTDSQWIEIGPTGGKVNCLKSFPDKPEIMLCSVLNGVGTFRSTNRGEFWEKIVQQPVHDMVILSNGKAYLAGPEGLLFSSDYGRTWQKLINHPAWQVIALEKGIIVVDTTGVRGIGHVPWRISRDAGKTWEPWTSTALTQTPWSHLFEPDDKPGSILFHQNGKIIRVDDIYIFVTDTSKWDNWTFSGTTYENDLLALHLLTDANSDSFLLAYSRFYDYHPSDVYDGGVYRSDDWGAHWRMIYRTWSSSIIALRKYNSFLFVGDESGEFIIYDLNSKQAQTLTKFGSQINDIDIARWDQQELMVATNGGIYYSNDGGIIWSKRDNGIQALAATAICIIRYGKDQERILLGTQNAGIFLSDNHGNSWEESNRSFSTLPGLIRSGNNVVYAGRDILTMSMDSGKNWQSIDNFPASYYGWYGRVIDIDIFPDSPLHILTHYYEHSLDHYKGNASIEGFYNPSEPDKCSWKKYNWFGIDYNFSCRAQIDSIHKLIWISQDYEWSRDSTGLMALDIKNFAIKKKITLPDGNYATCWLVDGNSIYVFNEKKSLFWKSTDAGETWTSGKLALNRYIRYDDWAAYQPFSQLALSPDKKQLFFLYPGNGVLTSYDGGDSWQPFNDGLPTKIAYQIEFSRCNPSVAYLAANNGFYKREIVTGLKDKSPFNSVLKDYKLFQNHPNPFNAQTQITFQISRPGHVTITIYNLAGEEVIQLLSDSTPAGAHKISWHGRDRKDQPVPSGIYWYQLKDERGYSDVRKMVLVK